MEENIFSLGMVQPKTKTKRPPNGYILYCLEKRTEFRTLHPDLPNIEISRMLGNEWKSLNEVDRRPYKEKAKILQAEFKLKNPDYRYEKAREKRHAQEIALQNRNQVSSFDGLQENFQAILNLLNASLGQQNHPMANSNVTQSISEPHISDFHPFGDFLISDDIYFVLFIHKNNDKMKLTNLASLHFIILSGDIFEKSISK